jgi:hypothetical protein
MKTYSLDEWLIDFPGQTAEFERLTQMLKDYPEDGPTIHQIRTRWGKRDREAVKRFLTWQVVQDAVAEGDLRRAEPWEAAVKQALSSLPSEYLDKLRYDCLVAANTRLCGASPEEVVAEAERDFEGRLRFLTEKSS